MFQQVIHQYKEDHQLSTFQPKAVLFDMDGVLYDSMKNHTYAWQEAMKKFGLDVPAEMTYQYEGMRGVETIQILMREQRNETIDEDEALRMYNEKARVFETLPTAPIMPGVLKLMHKIKDAGLQIVVVTGSAQKP